MVEVPQVGELVAEGVHDERVLQQPTGTRVPEADPDPAVPIANPIATLDVWALGLDRAKGEGVPARQVPCVDAQPREHALLFFAWILRKVHEHPHRPSDRAAGPVYGTPAQGVQRESDS